MVSIVSEQKRKVIAEKLAYMRARRNLLLADERRFLQKCNDGEIRARLEKMTKKT